MTEEMAEDWQWTPASRRTVVVNVVLAGVLLIAGTMFLLPGGSDAAADLASPPATADRVPSGPIIRKFRSDCGIRESTLGKLVPDPEPRTSLDPPHQAHRCRWTSSADDRHRREASVSIDVAPEVPRVVYTEASTAMTAPGASPVAVAIGRFAQKTGQEGRTGNATARENVSGLGDEASISYSPDTDLGGSSVVFRAGNAVVTATYRGKDLSAKRAPAQLPKDTARQGALEVATEAAKGLGLAGKSTPVVAAVPAGPPPIQQTFDPCDLVADGTVKKLVPRASGSQPEPQAKPETTVWCAWDEENGYRNLKVTLTKHPTVASASRTYVSRHVDARAEEPISAHDEKYFRAVRGLGDQAFAAYVEEGLPGRVLFRVRNILALITYKKVKVSNADPGENTPLTKDQAINGAYAAAREVAKKLASY